MGPPPSSLPSKTSMVSSSPGRAEKLPTPGFARLLRRKGSIRSRSQPSLSRSSPLFPSRRAAPSVDAATDGEPSSPKVTCIGQVRIRKKNRTSIRSDPKTNRAESRQNKRGESNKMRCCFITNSHLRNVFRTRHPIWRRWSKRLRFKRNAASEPTNDLEEIVFRKSERGDEEEAEEYDESETRVFVPPKNALLLMRCRSAPHNRSSALAVAFSSSGDGEDGGNSKDEALKGRESNGSCEEEEEEEEEEIRCTSSRPLFLKRCKSEPAKKAAKLASPDAARCSQNGDDDGNRRPAKSPSQLQ